MTSSSPPFTFATSEKKDLTYSAALSKGETLLKMMQADDATAGQMMKDPRPSASSQFLDPADLKAWGYHHKNEILAATDDLVTNVVNHLGLDATDSGLKTAVFDLHAHWTFHHKRDVPANEAGFRNFVSHQNGLFIAAQNFGPQHRISKWKTHDPVALPDLRHWSDMAYLQWIAPGEEAKNGELKYVFRHEIENSDTSAVIEHIFGLGGGAQDGAGLVWPPGVTFRMDEDHGKALLGTPHGSGVAWLLIQHKKQLGHKTVEKVTVLCKDEEDARMRHHPNLLFYLKDV